MRHHLFLLMLLGAVLCLSAQAKLTAQWSARTVVHGEKVLLMISDDSDNGAFELTAPTMAASAVTEIRDIYSDYNPDTGKITTILPIELSPVGRGVVQLAPLEIRYLQSGKTARVPVPPLQVLDLSHIQWFNDPVTYGVIWYDASDPYAMQHTDRELYVGQFCQLGVKLLLPQDVSVCAAPENKASHSGVQSSHFRSPLRGMHELVRRLHLPKPTAHIGPDVWQTANYLLTCAPTRSGKSTLNATMHLRSHYGQPLQLSLSPRQFSAMELPSGAPAGFNGCVGHISLTARSQASQLALYTPVEVQLDITGALNEQQPPHAQPEQPEGWAICSCTPEPLLNENGSISGTRLRLIMYPTAEVHSIPAFVVHYFDPEQMTYNSAKSEAIKLDWSATTGSAGSLSHADTPPAGDIPVEEMKDIYGYLPEDEAPVLILPRWIWWLLYLPAAGILGWMGWCRLQVYRAAVAASREQENELRALATLTDDTDFLKRVGAFIESRLTANQRNRDMQAILEQRDSEVFRPAARVRLSPQERQDMLSRIRKALGKTALLLLLVVLLGLPQSRGGQNNAENAYANARYTEAIQQLEARLHDSDANTARVYYNLGNCHYRLGEPGKAALCYSRALLHHPGFPEAQANLAFVMRRQGAVLQEATSSTDQLFTLLSCSRLKVCTYCATALLALGLALQLLWRGKPRPWLHTFTATALVACLLCAINHLYYSTRKVPDLSQLPPENLAWVITATELRSAPDHTAHSTMNQKLPAATPLHLLDVRGNWSRVETLTGTRGWILTQHTAPLSETTPTPAFLLEFR